jgi:hypothetical protein
MREWQQPSLDCLHSTVKRRGRPPAINPGKRISVYLNSQEAAFLSLWSTDGSPSTQFKDLLERAMKFWPAGPGRFR